MIFLLLDSPMQQIQITRIQLYSIKTQLSGTKYFLLQGIKKTCWKQKF